MHPSGAELLETNCAVVLLLGDRAYKVKKPVHLGFLDFRTREARERVCHREVELNRRLSPDVYLDVADVVGSDGRVCDHLVVMRRMPAELRLSALVGRVGEGDSGGGGGGAVPVEESLRQLARLMAAFHAAAPTSPQITAEGGAAALQRRWTANLRETERFRGSYVSPQAHAEIGRLAARFIDGRAPLFEERAVAGLVREGHGDLIADDVFCLPDGPRVLDCLEFDDRLRWLDVLDDVAFLAMDLEWLGRPELGRLFLDRYAEFSGAPAVASLEHHYIGYRAYVRAKIAMLRAQQGDPWGARGALGHAGLAVEHLRAGAITLLLVGGAPGTGKSTLASALADRLGWVVLSSDEIRRDLGPALGPDRYRAAAKRATYAELLRRAGRALEHGQSVIADATWASAAERDRAERVAEATSSDLAALRCRLPSPLAVERAARRRRHGGTLSEAGGRVAALLGAQGDPWPAATPVDTSGTPEDSLAAALAAVVRSGRSAPPRRRPAVEPG